jgi:hypothetical protein
MTIRAVSASTKIKWIDHTGLSSSFYVPFPELSQIVPESYVGTFNATDGNGNAVVIDVPAGDHLYKFCNQDIGQLREFPPILFATPARQPPGSEWMSDEQHFARVFGIASFWIMVAALFSLFNFLRKYVQIIYWRPFHRKQWMSPKPFSSIENESGYIPSATIAEEMYPVLFCNVSALPPSMMPWVDPEHTDYKPQSAIYDIPGLEKRSCFSTVHYWAPDEKLK